jgi:hypothetical protein
VYQLARLIRIIDKQGSNLRRQNTLVAKVLVVLATKMQKKGATALGSCVTKRASLIVHILFAFWNKAILGGVSRCLQTTVRKVPRTRQRPCA